MKRNAMGKNLQRSILRSCGRYIALLLIISLGAGLFIGLLMTRNDIVATGQVFMDQQKMFDLRLLTLYGWSENHVEEIARWDGIESAEEVVYADFATRVDSGSEDVVYRFYELPESINIPYLRAGRMPEREDECLVDATGPAKKLIGKKLVIAQSNEEELLEKIRVKEFTIVGCVASPLHICISQSNATVANGSNSSFVYVPQGVLDLGYIPEIHVTLGGESTVYTDAYKEAMKEGSEMLEPSLVDLAEERLQEVRREGEEAYAEGEQTLKDAKTEYRDQKRQAQQELQDAENQLRDAEQEIADKEQLLIDSEEKLKDSVGQLRNAEAQLAQGRADLENAKITGPQALAATEAELLSRRETLTAQLTTINASLAPIDAELGSVNGEIAAVQTAIAAVDAQIQGVNGQIASANATIAALQGQLGEDPLQAAEIQAQIAQQQALIAGYNATLGQLQTQRAQAAAPLAGLQTRRAELEAQRVPIASQQAWVTQQLSAVNQGIHAIPSAKEALAQELAAREAQLKDAASQIANGYYQLEQGRQELADGKLELENAKVDIRDAWIELEEQKVQAEEKFKEAEEELLAAEEELKDAREILDAMVVNRSTILDRDSNMGYANLENSSNIVQGISRVFPVFFLLVASLVCITTMTRMIDEERTEIGTLKAIGYTNDEIVRKYLYYSGSSALIGCVLGVLAGNTIFPRLLWDAYGVSFFMQPDVILTVNWPLCLAVVAVYMTILLLVTWYCCRRTLEEVPAELIRPKAPDAGKALFVERMPFWNRLSFLNKVMIRNIFRYRQRLAMMLVGIGGCTALLLTGFGIRDSMVSVVDVQFEEVNLYDMSVYFLDPLTEETKEKFLADTEGLAEKVAFYHQSSVDVIVSDDLRGIYLLSVYEDLEGFVDLHSGKDPVALPGPEELVLSIGTAQELGIEIGDTVTLRNADLQEMDLKVSGIYDNHVYNYAIVAPQTMEDHWGAKPEEQTAFVIAAEGMDVYAVSEEIGDMVGVMEVSVSEDQIAVVETLMGAVEMVLVIVVVCAGMLAAIVLYNLTNININERIREIATIKVLGFNAGETGAYVFKENMTLTIAGSILGLGLGWLLLGFVIAQIKVDILYFRPILLGSSYVWAVVLTILSALVVDYIFYFKLQKINMAEALKSVE